MKRFLLVTFLAFISIITVFSQNITKENFWPSNVALFDYTKANDVAFSGFLSPTAIDQYNTMLIHCKHYSDGYYYIAIPNENTCNVWLSSLTGMKELFLKNDQIAKENDVIADINKDVSDKFSFEGFFVSLWNYNVYIIGGGRWPVQIGVEYRYINRKSSMVLSVKQEGDYKWSQICTFNSIQDFDNMINAVTWSNFMEVFETQVQEIKKQQQIEAKKKADAALFD